MKIALLAGTQSGCGKTTIMLALLQYFKEKNQNITPFKAGPDFLDPMWHSLLSGKTSYNLDTRMIGLNDSKLLLEKQSLDTEIALIEGVMGLFDGRSGVGQEGSSADLAKGLGAPVILVVNAKGISGSIVPLVSGYYDYANRMGITICGVIANHVGSPHHASLLKAFLLEHQLPPLLAWMEKQAPALPERHLGLVTPDSASSIANYLPYFHVDEELVSIVFSDYIFTESINVANTQLLKGKQIAIAKDAASCFIYQANIDWLRQQDAEISYFSILNGETVPKSADALWLPGGYPEIYAEQLAQSASWDSISQFIEAEHPVLAECGGSMMLGSKLIDLQGQAWGMGGVLPFSSKMQTKLAGLGYRADKSGVKGHEFHYSMRETEECLMPAFDCARGDKGVRYKNLRASYIHWYFASAPEVVANWFNLEKLVGHEFCGKSGRKRQRMARR